MTFLLLSVFNFEFMLMVLLPGIILSGGASWFVQIRFSEYSKIPSTRGFTGRMAAQRLLDFAGISDVSVVRVDSILTDHYNPTTKQLALSSAVYDRTSVAAIGVAAHEAGHAIQHATGYFPLKLRSMIVPVANIGTKFGSYVMFAGIAIIAAGQTFGQSVFVVGALTFLMFVLFQLITLPVEFNASNRAKELVAEAGIVGEQERDGIEKVLGAAALTYVAAFISSVLTLIYFLNKSGLLKGNERQRGL